MIHASRSLIRHSLIFLGVLLLSACQTLEQNTSTTLSGNKNVARLQQALPIYEAAARQPWPKIPPTHHILHVGTQSDTVLLIRERLKATRDLPATDSGGDIYDQALATAVALFQTRVGLKADGAVGNDTIAELNVPPQVRINAIRLNMQRWANLAGQLGDRFVIVNIPEYQLHLIDNGQEVLKMKVIVGKPTRPTPELSSTITQLEFNPYWDVPRLIAQKDIVPKQIEDPNYLAENNIHIYSAQERNTAIDQQNIDWREADANGFKYHFRQEPGDKNALGRVRFEFSNSHDVYLHDTPAKNLFSSMIRDFSSGCVRLENPFNLVSYLTQNDDRLSNEKVQSIIASKKNTYFSLRRPIPIHLTYITAWVDDNGILHFARDIYKKDGTAGTNVTEQGEKHLSAQNVKGKWMPAHLLV